VLVVIADAREVPETVPSPSAIPAFDVFTVTWTFCEEVRPVIVSGRFAPSAVPIETFPPVVEASYVWVAS
jgi:hypothetical protein